ASDRTHRRAEKCCATERTEPLRLASSTGYDAYVVRIHHARGPPAVHVVLRQPLIDEPSEGVQRSRDLAAKVPGSKEDSALGSSAPRLNKRDDPTQVACEGRTRLVDAVSGL